MPLGSEGGPHTRPVQPLNNSNPCKHNIEIVKDTYMVDLMKSEPISKTVITDDQNIDTSEHDDSLISNKVDKGTETDQMNSADTNSDRQKVKCDDNRKKWDNGLTCNGTVSDENATTEDDLYEEFKTNIRNSTRNRTYHKFAIEKINGHSHVLAMTDDLIVDINKDTRKVNSFNPTNEQYKNLHALLLERGDVGCCVNQRDMYFLKSALQDIIKVQVMKSDLHN